MHQEATNSKSNQFEEVDLKKLFSIIYKGKLFVMFLTSLAAVFAVLYSLSLPNIYSSSVLLAPSTKDESLNSNLGSYSTIASFAGLNLPIDRISRSQEAVKRIESLEFFSEHFMPHINLQDLMAYEKWIPQDNVSIYDETIFNQDSGKWIREVAYPKSQKPSAQESFRAYKNAVSIFVDTKTLFVNIVVRHQSPYIAKSWADLIVLNINESMREVNKKSAQDAIHFLNEAYQTSNVQSLKDAISYLLEKEMQTLMLASTHSDYIFKVIDSAVVPEKKSSPNRAYICIISVIFAFISSVIILFVNYYWSNFRKTRQ